MNAGVTFERVYRALKDQIGAGRFVPGQHLEPGPLSQTLNASITPVRDALHRLAGEGLVETPRGDGFRIPHLTEVGLRHLYRWNGALLALAARSRDADSPPGPREPATPSGAVDRTERLFLAIADGAGNPEQAAAIGRLNDRLRAVRLAEPRVIGDPGPELDDLETWHRESEKRLLRRALAAYHRRRERKVDELVAALLAPR